MAFRPSYSRWIEQNRASNRKSNQPSLLPLRGNNSLVGCYYFQMFFSQNCLLSDVSAEPWLNFFVDLSKKSGINECLWGLKANVGRPLILTLKVLFIRIKGIWFLYRGPGTNNINISLESNTERPSRLLFSNGCFWWDYIAEVKQKFSLADAFFSSNWWLCSLLPDAFILNFFLDQKVKNSDF